MSINELPDTEESLDPEDWEQFKQLGHKMIDDMTEYFKTVRMRPVWQSVPDKIKNKFNSSLPQEPQSIDEVYKEFCDFILPYPMGNIHPRFWSWVIGTGTPFAMLAEMLAAGMNPNLGGAEHGANYVEAQVIDWCKEMFQYPRKASGLLVSGCSIANLIGLTVARNVKAGFNIRKEGLSSSKLIYYGSIEMHSSIEKALQLLGLGSNALRKIPVNNKYQIDLAALKKAIYLDRDKGLLPICIIGNAGTVNTGVFDELEILADICKQENMWFHIDGAFGALTALAPELSYLVNGINRADSLAFDMHKWMYLPYEIGCVLVKNQELHHNTFSMTPDYLSHETQRGLSSGTQPWFSDYGIQLSRGFKALKAWMSIKEHGIKKYGRLIKQNVDQAKYLSSLINSEPNLELLAPVISNIVCFRYNPNISNTVKLNDLNKELLLQLHESGVAVCSDTILNGNYALRVAITNHRTIYDDLKVFIKEVKKIGKNISVKK